MKKILLLFSVFLFFSCYKDPEIVSIDDVEFLKVSGDTIKLKIVSGISNPNRMKLKADDIKVEFSINDLALGNSSIEEQVVLEPKKINVISTHTDILLPAISKILPDIIKKDSFPVKIIMKAKFSSLKIPLTKKFVKQMSSKELIESFLSGVDMNETIQVEKIKILEAGIDSTKLQLSLKFKNSFPFDYQIIKMDSDIYSSKDDNVLIGKSVTKNEISVKKDSIQIIPVFISISNKNTFKGFLKNLINKNLSVYLRSKILMRINKYEFSVPYDTEFELPKPEISIFKNN